MSDDLVKRLRGGSIWGQSVQDTLTDWMMERQDAANRIEKLENERDEHWKSFVFWREEWDKLREQLRAKETQLANAVECQYLNACIEMVDELYDSSLAAQARTTLAELKGEQP